MRGESWKFVPADPVDRTMVPRFAIPVGGLVMRSVAEAVETDGQATARVLQVLFAGEPKPLGQGSTPPPLAEPSGSGAAGMLPGVGDGAVGAPAWEELPFPPHAVAPTNRETMIRRGAKRIKCLVVYFEDDPLFIAPAHARRGTVASTMTSPWSG